jgi:hypothetical protein
VLQELHHDTHMLRDRAEREAMRIDDDVDDDDYDADDDEAEAADDAARDLLRKAPDVWQRWRRRPGARRTRMGGRVTVNRCADRYE